MERQASTKTPTFFANPRTDDSGSLAERLERVSLPACAGAIRRLAAPDL